MRIERVGDVKFNLGEGPLWDVAEQALYFTDLLGAEILCWHPNTGGFEHLAMPTFIGSMALIEGGGALVALVDGFHLYDFETGSLIHLGDPEADQPITRWNDGKVDSRGRFLAGTLDPDLQHAVCGLYSLDRGSTTRLDTGFTCTNGPCWSPDGETFYFADSVPGDIYAYDYDLDTGQVSGRRKFANTLALGGVPDGATTDSEGRLWSAICGSGKIACYAPNGHLEQVVEVPARLVSSVMFGGTNLDQLFFTTIDGAAVGDNALGFTPDAAGGHLFVIEDLGVTGLPEPRYRP